MSEAKETASAVPKSLVKKLAEVMGEVERIPKSGHNKFHNYDYATEADIVEAVRKGMAIRGLMLISDIAKIEWQDIPTKNGKEFLCTLTVKFTFMDGETGETLSFNGMGQGSDSRDKAIYKALTGAEKYALLKTFLIPTGDDPEKDDTPAESGRRTAPQQTAARSAKETERPKAQDAAKQLAAQKAMDKEAPKQPQALRVRCLHLWNAAHNRGGMTLEAFKEWIALEIGAPKSSTELTEADVEKLEASLRKGLAEQGVADSQVKP